MKIHSKLPLFLLQIGMGWLLFYAGITKVLNPEWSAAGYLTHAQTFSGVYQWFASPANIGWVNFLNEWGLTIIGAALLLGIGVRAASFFGVLLMLLYYFPILDFPYAGEHSYIVDDHIMYVLALIVIGASAAGRTWGIDAIISHSVRQSSVGKLIFS